MPTPTLPPAGRDVLINGVRELRAWHSIVSSERRDAHSAVEATRLMILGQRIADVSDRLVRLLATPDAGGES